MKAVPIMATSTVVMAALAAANERLRNRRRSKSGRSTRSSQTTQAVSNTTAAANRARMGADSQPHVLLWISASVTLNRPADTRPTPVMSIGAVERSRLSRGTSVAASAMPMAPTGTLNQKIRRQELAAMSAPPSAGPSEAASVLSPPKRPAANP